MGWTGEGDAERYEPEYRIEVLEGGFEPQFKYLVRDYERWYALLPNGYMADPNVWNAGSSGESYVRVILPTKEDAERAILRAKTINDQNKMTAV